MSIGSTFSLPSLSIEETDRQTDATGGGAGGWMEGRRS